MTSSIPRRGFIKGSLTLLFAPHLLSCNDGPSEAPPSDPRLTARPGDPTLTPPSGQSSLGLGDSRDGILYVPASYSADTPAPLFVGLHGAGGEGSSWLAYSAALERLGMILLAPDSRSSTWDLLRGGFGPDVSFLDRALTHAFERCRIDPARIALGGFSDGASYALSLGVSNGDLFSHLVAYSPGIYSPSEPLVGKPRIYVSHGTQDSILPVTVSRDIIVPSLRSSGYDVLYQEFDGGHQVPASISEAALDWFLS